MGIWGEEGAVVGLVFVLPESGREERSEGSEGVIVLEEFEDR